VRPKFSIIIPLYNKSAFIQATLNSVQQQEYSLYEVIVIDDGSTDDSLEKVQKYTGISLRIFS